MSDDVLNLGRRFYVTPGVQAAVSTERLYELLDRYRRGEWANMDAHDVMINHSSARVDGRVLVEYAIDPTRACDGDNRIWIITEGIGADRRTTFLLPDEY